MTTYDWKKHASQVVDDSAVEKAFMDQAYGFIANKAGPLMNDPYRLGFEIVHKNDANTRMVGIFAFRIGDNLLYAPVFFLNGDLKGTDLLYRTNTKTFVPLTTDWCTFLVEKHKTSEGRGISRMESRKSPTDLELQRIIAPPSTGGFKSAAESMADGKFPWELEPLLKDFLLSDGGMPAFRKIASAIERDPLFADALYRSVPEQAWMPSELQESVVKKASAKDVLVLHTGMFPPDGVKSANHFRDGFTIEDTRKEASLSPVYEDMTSEMSGVSESGVYNVLLRGGDTDRRFCAPSCSTPVGCDCHSACYPTMGDYVHPSYGSSKNLKIRTISLGGDRGTCTSYSTVLGSKVDENETDKTESCCEPTMSAGSAYCILSSGSLSDPIYCDSASTADGITKYKIYTHGYSSPVTITHNPDSPESSIAKGILGKGTSFIHVGVESMKSESSTGSKDYKSFYEKTCDAPGEDADLRAWILGSGVKKASLHHKDNKWLLSFGAKRHSGWMPKSACAVRLCRDLRLGANVSSSLMDAAAAKDSTSFYILPKSASVIKVIDEPEWDWSNDSVFSVRTEPAKQTHTLATETDYMDAPEPRVGDAYGNDRPSNGDSEKKDGIPHEFVMSLDPQGLADMAKRMGAPHVFDHGMVGSLVQTFDSATMIDKYVPKLEEALDSLGRILFLFYWKPGDFQSAYGADDMSNMENKLLSNFQSFGNLVLDLMKKSRNKKEQLMYRTD